MDLLERLGEFARSEHGRLALWCAGASAATAIGLLGVQSVSRSARTDKLRAEANIQAGVAVYDHRTTSLSANGAPVRKDRPAMDESLIREQLSRNYIFFGDEGVDKIRKSFIVVVGVGGVGSWTATMLVRAGVGKVRIIDFDQVTLSSLNRHACATLDDVGTSKVGCLQRYLHRVAPWVEIDCRNELFRKEDAAELLAPWTGADDRRPDFVVDAIDNIDTKADLLAYCHTHKIKVVASMGAGCKADPTRVLLNDISMTTDDPLSRQTRRHLRLRGISHGIPTVYSVERIGPGKASLRPPDEAAVAAAGGKIDEFGILPNFRAGVLPVLGTMPAVFGLVLATYVLTQVGEYPVDHAEAKERDGLYDKALQDLTNQHQRLNKTLDNTGFFAADMSAVIEEAAKGRSVIPPFHGTRLSVTKLDHDRPLTFDNLLVLHKNEAQKHEANVLKQGLPLSSYYDEEALAAIDKYRVRLKELERWREIL
ncbi:hypothetical protein PYCC9005_001845 [Savitreella phatthalungensis]